jgi:hypothetical protein
MASTKPGVWGSRIGGVACCGRVVEGEEGDGAGDWEKSAGVVAAIRQRDARSRNQVAIRRD